MATFALICIDKPGALALRMANRADHLAYVGAQRDVVRLAGPFLDAAGEMAGSMLILEAPDLAAVQAFSDADPYVKAGLFERVEIRPWRVGIGQLP
jgi:uncharacterized protein YciI